MNWKFSKNNDCLRVRNEVKDFCLKQETTKINISSDFFQLEKENMM